MLQEEIEMHQVKTDDQVADLFTKGLNGGKLEKFRKQLNMCRAEAGVEGEC